MDFKNWGSQKINSRKCSTIWSWIQCECSSLFTTLTPVCWSQTLIRLRNERNESGKNHHEIQIALISPSGVQRYILRCILFLHIPVLRSWSSSHPLEVFSFGRNTWKSQQPSHTHHVPSGYKRSPLPQVEKHTTPAWFQYHVLHTSNMLHTCGQHFPNLGSWPKMSKGPVFILSPISKIMLLYGNTFSEGWN